ncbi:hypothetical protein KAS50_02240, partial [bacterium]|nr:hypothetical protein [bacterium]
PRKIARVEVAVDGKILDQMVMHTFENILINVGALKPGVHNITVYAYDRYLNCSKEEIRVE